jgi:hypothetical protein
MGAVKKTLAAAATLSASPAFEKVVAAFKGQDGIEEPGASRRKFGSNGLKVNGKIFAMLVKGALVVKLPKARVEALVGAGTGVPFDPGHGRLMKEWVSVAGAEDDWLPLAREAHGFVAAKGG